MNNKNTNQLEGSGGSQLIQLMRKFGSAVGLDISVATVTETSPLSIRIKGDPFDLSGDELIVSERLTTHSRRADIVGGTVSGQTSPVTVPFKGGNSSHKHTLDDEETSSATIQFSGTNESHLHDIKSLPLTQNNVNITIKSPLTVGDEVIVIIAQDGQLYYVIDKAEV